MKKFRLIRGFWLILLRISSISSDFVPLKARQSGDQPDTAMYAVDNNTSTCSLAAESYDYHRTADVYGWLQVDLGNSFIVTSVTLTNPNSFYESQFLQNFAIFVSDSNSTDSQWDHLCAQFNNGSAVAMGATITFACNNPLIGRYVTIRREGGRPTRQDAISICEVSITYNSSGSSISTTTTTSTSISTSSSTTTSTVPSTSTSTTTSTRSLSAMSGSPSGSSPTVSSADGYTKSATTPTTGNSSSVESVANDSAKKKQKEIAIICPVVIIGGLIILVTTAILLFVFLRKKRQKKEVKFYENAEELQEPKGNMNDAFNSEKPKPPVKPKKPSLLQQPIKANDLIAYVERMQVGDTLKDEFKKLPEEDLDQVKLGKRSENNTKNRFKNILPYDHSIVSLATKDSDDKDKNYINANYITGYKNVEKMYIATQGPKVETVDDFWRMVWLENANLVVMTTLLNELGKKKCEQYWPTKVNEKKSFGNISVRLTREDVLANHVYREMEIQDGKKEKRPPRTVRHMHFLMWEDKQKPTDYLPVLAFRRKVRELQEISSQPIVVHCSAGVGRTGTYIALDILLEQLKHDGQVSFFKCVEDLRAHRMNMVQTWKQYSFLHEAVADYFQTGDTSIPCKSFAVKHGELLKKSPNGSKLEQQFELLQKLRDLTTDNESAGSQSQNIDKNRDKDIVAYDTSRLYLDVDYDESDYINAIYVEGRRSREARVLTQLPLKDTIVDFWRLLWDHKLKLVVLLGDIRFDEQQFPKFWPEEGVTEKYGPFTVTAGSVAEKFPSIFLREFSLEHTNKTRAGTLTVRQYQVKNWSNRSPVPSSPSQILPLINELLTNHSSGARESVVFQCTDGTLKSGLMAAAMYVAETIKEESNVDIFYACRIVALNRPQIISSMEQYSFLHELSSAFIRINHNVIDPNMFDSSSTYANCETHPHPVVNESEYSNCQNSVI